MRNKTNFYSYLSWLKKDRAQQDTFQNLTLFTWGHQTRHRWLFKCCIAIPSTVKISIHENVLGKPTALSSKYYFIRWIALSTFWTTGAWSFNSRDLFIYRFIRWSSSETQQSQRHFRLVLLTLSHSSTLSAPEIILRFTVYMGAVWVAGTASSRHFAWHFNPFFFLLMHLLDGENRGKSGLRLISVA